MTRANGIETLQKMLVHKEPKHQNTESVENLMKSSVQKYFNADKKAAVPPTFDKEKVEEHIHAVKCKVAELHRLNGLKDRERIAIRNPLPQPNHTWVENQQKLEKMMGLGVIATLLGTRGNGKTIAAAMEINRACNASRSARYATVFEFYLDVRTTFNEDAKHSEREVVQNYCRPQLLVLDEMQVRSDSKWEDMLLTHVIDRRHREMKDTILIANQTVDEFIASVGPSVIDRTAAGGGILLYKLPSLRGK